MIVGEILADLYFNPENVDKQGRPTFKNLPVMDKIITRPALPITMNRTKIDNILRKVGENLLHCHGGGSTVHTLRTWTREMWSCVP